MSTGVGVLAAAGLRGRRRGGLAATLVVLTLSAVAISAGLVVSRQGARLLDDAAAEANVAHLVVYGKPAAIGEVAGDDEVVAWSGPFATVTDVELVLASENVPIEVAAIDDPDIAVNRPLMRDGRWARTAEEMVLDYSITSDLGIDIGDELTFRREAVDVRFRVVGTAVNFTDCFYPQCEPGRVWTTSGGLERFQAGDDVYAQGFLRFDDPAQAEPFVERQAAGGVEGIGGTNSWLDTRGDFLTLDRVFGSFVTAFGVFVLAVAAVIVAGSTAMRIVTRRRDIGLMAAIGSTPRQITGALLVENAAIGLVAAVAGWGVAGLLVSSLQLGIGRTLGPQGPSWTIAGLVAAAVLIAVLLTVATIVPARAAARRPVTDVLRDVPPDRVSWLNRRVRRVPERLALLGAREAASQPVRSGLAALAVGVAVIGTIVSIGFVGALDRATTDAAMAGDPWDVTVVPTEASGDEVEAALGDAPGIEQWFTETERRSTYHDGSFLSVAVGGDPEAAAYRIAGGRALRAPGEAIVGYGFMERFDVDVGSRVDFLAGTTPLSLEVVGWYRDTEDSGEILRYRLDDLVRAEPDITVDVYRLALSADVDAAVVAAWFTERLGDGARIEILDTGREDMAPLFVALRLISVVLLLTAGINLLSTLLTASRESARRTGVQLTLGFTPRQLLGQGAVNGMALGVLATAVGLPLGLWLFRVLADVVSTGIGVGPGWMPMPSPMTLVAVAALAIVVSAGLGALAVRRIANRPPAELVRAE